MTTQEAIEILRDTPIDIRSTREDDIHTLYATAQGMAIEALQRGLENVNADSCSEKPNRSDVVYRQDVIGMIQGVPISSGTAKAMLIFRAKELPSVQPEERTEERTETHACDLISRQDAIDATWEEPSYTDPLNVLAEVRDRIKALPSAQPEGYVKIPETGIDDLSDGYHTFRQLYYQRMMLFATIVKQNKEKAWKSLRHEDGELCFGGGWFIVGIDTPEGSYTYHYEDNFYSMFDCKELERARHWDGHTEQDVTRLLSLPSAQPEIIRCKDCAKREYCRTSTVWAVAPDDNWYCADAERRADE